jgi:hypothetical protein
MLVAGISTFLVFLFLVVFPLRLPAQQGFDNIPGSFLMEGEDPETAEGRGIARNIRIITREEIKKYNARDLGTLLQEVLHISLTNYGPYGSPSHINVRGFDSAGIAFLVNGVSANSVVSGGFDYSQINIDSIERIEFINGGSGSRYHEDGGLGGTINIVTMRQERRGYRAGGSVSNLSAMPGSYANGGDPHGEDLFDAQRLSLTGGMMSEAMMLSGNIFTGRAGNHFLYTRAEPAGTYRNENNELWDVGGAASLTLLFPNMASMSLSADAYYGDKKLQALGAPDVSKDSVSFSSRQMLKIDLPELGRGDISSELILNNSQGAFPYTLSDDELFHNEYVVTLIDRTAWFALPQLTSEPRRITAIFLWSLLIWLPITATISGFFSGLNISPLRICSLPRLSRECS